MAAIDCWLAAPPTERKRLEGTYHLVASGQTSWHGFAQAIMERAAARKLIASVPTVLPISTVDFPTPAPRPAYSVLDNTGFTQAFNFELPHWEYGLDRVMQQLH